MANTGFFRLTLVNHMAGRGVQGAARGAAGAAMGVDAADTAVAAVAAITAIWATSVNINLMTKTDRAIAAFSCLDKHFGGINKHNYAYYSKTTPVCTAVALLKEVGA